jgi:hypothetical protein
MGVETVAAIGTQELDRRNSAARPAMSAPASATPLRWNSSANALGHARRVQLSERTSARARGRFSANSCGSVYWQA